jgi:hypothetical protein
VSPNNPAYQLWRTNAAEANDSIASLRRYLIMNYRPDNALQNLKNSPASVILRRHVSEKQRNNFTSLRF